MYLCNETITVYNKQINEKKFNQYFPTVLKGIHWFGTEQVNVSNSGLIGAKMYTLRIPESVYTSGKEFVKPKAYQKGDHEKVFTFDEGDIIVRGEVVIPDATPSKLQQDYDDVITIISVTDNRMVPNAPHWRVVGK